MDFTTMPPEITSTLLYAGPGAETMLSAAEAWDSLAAQLDSTSADTTSVLGKLTTESWHGPSATTMATAVEPFTSWLTTTAATAKHAGEQLRAAAAAYAAAVTAAVPPGAVSANRARLATLLATNVVGQNTAAIAAAEAQYAQMWAQDAAAMHGYAAAAGAATRLRASTAPPQPTHGLAGTAAGMTGSGGTTGTDLLGSLSSTYPDLFGSSASMMKFEGIANGVMSVPNLGMVQFKTFFKPLELLPDIPGAALGAGLGGPGFSALGAGLGASSALTVPTSAASGGLVRAVAADIGAAPSVGALSVPPGWATASPAVRLATATGPAPAAGFGAASVGAVLNPATLGSAAGGALGIPGNRSAGCAAVRGGAAGARHRAPVKLDQALARLQRNKDTVQHWQVNEGGLDQLLDELAKKPGFHAVHLTKDIS